MNLIHNVVCSSRWWSGRVERELVPWALDGLELGETVLEIGPGFGATARLLACRPTDLTRWNWTSATAGGSRKSSGAGQKSFRETRIAPAPVRCSS